MIICKIQQSLRKHQSAWNAIDGFICTRMPGEGVMAVFWMWIEVELHHRVSGWCWRVLWAYTFKREKSMKTKFSRFKVFNVKLLKMARNSYLQRILGLSEWLGGYFKGRHTGFVGWAVFRRGHQMYVKALHVAIRGLGKNVLSSR